MEYQHLDTCINEALPPPPPIPSGSQRVPPTANGRLVGSQSVPQPMPTALPLVNVMLYPLSRAHTCAVSIYDEAPYT